MRGRCASHIPQCALHAGFPPKLPDSHSWPPDQAEFDALAALPDFPWQEETDTLGWTSPADLPVPVHRILRSSVDEALERYAGITSADLTNTEGTLYLPDYDAWYTFTSDFGPGMFVCAGGQVDEAAGTALLWTDTREDGSRTELTLERDGEDWHIRSHRDTADDLLLELLAELEGEDIGSVSWYGSSAPPEADELAALIDEVYGARLAQGSVTIYANDEAEARIADETAAAQDAALAEQLALEEARANKLAWTADAASRRAFLPMSWPPRRSPWVARTAASWRVSLRWRRAAS